MIFDVTDCVFPYTEYSDFLKSKKMPLVLEDQEGNGIPNPRFKFSWCWVAEEYAAMLLNSGEIENPWRGDFEKDRSPHEMWDLINSDNITIEVKSTTSETEFSRTSVRLNVPEQSQSIILKLFIGERGFISAKFVVKQDDGKWLDISDMLEQFKDW